MNSPDWPAAASSENIIQPYRYFVNDRILIVDDEENILSGIQRQLHKQFAVSTAVGPEKGLELIRQKNEFAVVISDMRMPGMNGVDFLGKVQGISPNSIRMMLTGKFRPTDRHGCHQPGQYFPLHDQALFHGTDGCEHPCRIAPI